MKAIVKGLLIGLVIILLGAGILVGALALGGWKLPSDVSFEKREYASSDEVRQLSLSVNCGEVRTLFYEGETLRIVYPYAEQYVSEITESDGTLTFSNPKIKWYHFALKDADLPQVTIYLPRNAIDLDIRVNAGTCAVADGNYGAVSLEVNAGVLTVEGAACSSLRCEVNAGVLDIRGADCPSLDCKVAAGKLTAKKVVCPAIAAEISAGALDLSVQGVLSEYTVRKTVSAGSCNLENRTGTTEKLLTVNVSAGSAAISFTE